MKNEKPTDRFERALSLAHRLHQNQVRKGTPIPYIAHLMAVSSLVLEDGGSEDEAIAALLHDAVEDQGGRPTLDRIRELFGQRVAELVEGCTDAYGSPKPPWRKRKEDHLAHLAQADPGIQRIKTADMLHNIRCTLKGFRESGAALWERFSVGRDEQLWYYRSACRIFSRQKVSAHLPELRRTVALLARLCRASAKATASPPLEGGCIGGPTGDPQRPTQPGESIPPWAMVPYKITMKDKELYEKGQQITQDLMDNLRRNLEKKRNCTNINEGGNEYGLIQDNSTGDAAP
jgi:hypothetical protein